MVRFCAGQLIEFFPQLLFTDQTPNKALFFKERGVVFFSHREGARLLDANHRGVGGGGAGASPGGGGGGGAPECADVQPRATPGVHAQHPGLRGLALTCGALGGGGARILVGRLLSFFYLHFFICYCRATSKLPFFG